ncbi:MAG: hypothetical protein ACYTBJ_07425, partial [Planctomycetota bacterium]
MTRGKCPSHCGSHCRLNRRDFICGSAALFASSAVFGGCSAVGEPKAAVRGIRPCGPGSEYVPTIKAAFVRRKE